MEDLICLVVNVLLVFACVYAGFKCLVSGYDTELSPGQKEVQAGREPLGGIRSHPIFGSCMPGGERCGWEGSPVLWGASLDLQTLGCAFLSW